MLLPTLIRKGPKYAPMTIIGNVEGGAVCVSGCAWQDDTAAVVGCVCQRLCLAG